MFSRPEFGWTTVWIGKTMIGEASYLTEPMIDTIQNIIDYLCDNDIGLYIKYDSEGQGNFGITTISDDLYVFHDDVRTGGVILRKIKSHNNLSADEIAARILVSALKSLAADQQRWEAWQFDNDPAIIQQRKAVFSNLYAEAVHALKEKRYVKNDQLEFV